MLHTLALSLPGPFEMIILAGLGLLFFGKRLPDVGRSIGKTIVEFKKGMKDVETEVDRASNEPAPSPAALPQSHKFDPYTGQPLTPKFDPFTGKPIEADRVANNEQKA